MQKNIFLKNKMLKRIFDISISGLLLLILIPIFLMLSLIIYLAFGSPILFRQTRPGLNQKLFIIFKFRSMTSETDCSGCLLPDSLRLTKFGKLLRSTSLDELPELWNVLKGDMSLVGPRPLLTEYLPLYSKHHARRHEMRPGITGLAQIKGRNRLNWDERLDLDIWYIDNWTLLSDLKILFITAVKVLRREGVSHPGHATMERFTGSSRENG